MKNNTILTLINLREESSRELLRGILDTNSRVMKWSIHIMDASLPHNSTKMVVRTAKKIHAQAFIGKVNELDMAELSKLDIPLVLKARDTTNPSYSYITADNIAVGEEAAKFYKNQHYKHYGFIGFAGAEWSSMRMKGFVNKLNDNTADIRVLEINDLHDCRDELLSFIKSLTFPTAIMACNDRCARMIANICTEEGIKIPSQVSIIGVDDDEFICTVSEPELSSIRLGIREQGRELAQQLQAQIGKKGFKNFIVLSNIKKIIERGSTMPSSDKKKLISKVISHIDENYPNIDNVADILDVFPISERSLQIRFKQETNGQTIYKYLINKKIEHMKELLKTTNYSIKEVAFRSGFYDIYKVSRVFKREVGISPKEYRNRNKY